jgi:hypothetical protein
MKNLILLSEDRHSVSPPAAADSDATSDFVETISALLANPNVDHDDPEFADPQEAFHYILSPNGRLSGLSSSDSIIWSIDLNQFVEPDDDDDDYDDENNNNVKNEDGHVWFHLSHEENNDVLVALSRDGAILSISLDGKETELIGCFDHGIQCAAWSADAELLALLTFQETELEDIMEGEDENPTNNPPEGDGMVPVLMTMNTQFEILSEVPLPHHAPNQPISLCWNKKTDRQLIAVSTHDVQDNQRKIRIFQGDSLEPIATSRTEDGSGRLIPNILPLPSIAWGGSNASNLLACVQRKGRKGRMRLGRLLRSSTC